MVQVIFDIWDTFVGRYFLSDFLKCGHLGNKNHDGFQSDQVATRNYRGYKSSQLKLMRALYRYMLP